MDLSVYLFATYVFLLLCVVIWLLGRVLRKSKKASADDKAGYDKEQKLFSLYQNVEDMLASFEEYVEESQSEADKNLSDMKNMLEEVKRLAGVLKSGSAPAEVKEMAAAVIEKPDKTEKLEKTVKPEEPIAERTEPLYIMTPAPLKISDEPKRPAPIHKMSKTGSKVLELRANGMNQSEIAKHLGISVREVSLAMKIAGAGDDK